MMQSLTQPMLSTLSAIAGSIGIVAAFVAAGMGLVTFVANAELSRRSDLRIVQNEATTAKAGAKAAMADAKAAEANLGAASATEAAATANRAAAEANSRAAQANERAEHLRNDNLNLQRSLLDLQKSVRGREISDEQQQIIVKGARKLNLPDLVVYYNEQDPEAKFYAISINSVLQDIGLKGRMAALTHNPPQLGVAYYGTGTPDERRLIELLLEAKIVSIAAIGPDVFPDASTASVMGAPPGSIIVGQKPPGSTLRVSEAGRPRGS